MKSVRTTIRVFEAVAAHQPIGLSELSRRLEVPKASVQRALTSLAEAGWLRQDRADTAEPGRWVVSARFALLAEAAPAVVAVRESARPQLEALRASTGLAVGLLVLDGDHMVLVGGPDGTGGSRGSSVLRAIEESLGPLPVHVSAAGRAILSRLPLSTRREVLDRALRRYTPQSITQPEAVLAEVAKAERDGYAVTRGEFQSGMSVVAAPILERHALPVAAVAIFVPDEQLAGCRKAELGAAAQACASAIGEQLLAIPSVTPASG
jgi:IclR family acetate operon transcriptional repressor